MCPSFVVFLNTFIRGWKGYGAETLMLILLLIGLSGKRFSGGEVFELRTAERLSSSIYITSLWQYFTLSPAQVPIDNWGLVVVRIQRDTESTFCGHSRLSDWRVSLASVRVFFALHVEANVTLIYTGLWVIYGMKPFLHFQGYAFEMQATCSLSDLMISDLSLVCSPMPLTSCIKTRSGLKAPTTQATLSPGTARSMWSFLVLMSWISRSPWILSWSLC